jgi:hypothetical protein
MCQAPRTKGDIIKHGSGKKLIFGVLDQHGHLAWPGRPLKTTGVLHRITAVKQHFSLSGPCQECQLERQSGFAAAGSPQHGEQVAGLDGQVPLAGVL